MLSWWLLVGSIQIPLESTGFQTKNNFIFNSVPKAYLETAASHDWLPADKNWISNSKLQPESESGLSLVKIQI